MLAERRTGREDVLNGIAWDAKRRRLFVTGKYWSRLFQARACEGLQRIAAQPTRACVSLTANAGGAAARGVAA